MKALVTGGAGFIGSHLVDVLLEGGDEVVVVDCLSTGSVKNIVHHFSNPKFTFLNQDIVNHRDGLDGMVRDVDVIFHLAAAVGVRHIVGDPLRAIVTNVAGTENIFDLAYRFWKKVVLASTSEVYGRNPRVPLEEESERILGSTRVNRWSYSASKAIDEHIAFAYHDKGLPVTIVRYFNSYGPRINEDAYGTVVAQFIRQALRGENMTVHGDGKQTRCFTYVSDTVAGTLLSAEKKEALGLVFNIGNTHEASILELAQMTKELTGSSSEITFVPYSDYYGQSYEDTPRRVPDISRARKILNFKPSVSLKEGLEKTIAWCKENYKV